MDWNSNFTRKSRSRRAALELAVLTGRKALSALAGEPVERLPEASSSIIVLDLLRLIGLIEFGLSFTRFPATIAV
jgi:hypothetical protein